MAEPMPSETCTLSDTEALRLARQGDVAAFEWLYRKHCQRVYALCLRMVKNTAQAEDLTQETFLAVFRGIRAFRGQSAFTTWLHRVTRNTVLMCFRKKKLKETSLEEIACQCQESGRPPKELGTRDRRLENLVDRIILEDGVAQLPGGFRAALLLHDVHGYQHSEVAAMLGCRIGTSKSQLHKARLRLREMLEKFLRREKRALDGSNGHSAGKAVPPAQRIPSLRKQAGEKPRSDRAQASIPGDWTREESIAVPRWCRTVDEAPSDPNM